MGERLDDFMEELCTRRQLISVIFFLAVFLIAIQLPYLFFVEWGSALSVVSVMNVVGFSVFAVVSGALLRHCDRRMSGG